VTKILNLRGSQRFSKRAANAPSIECGYVQTNSKGEKLMNTHSNALQPEKEVHRTARNVAIITVILTLVIAAAIAFFIANRPVVAAEKNPAVTYSNALEMQYARPWLEAQNKPVVAYSNALEMQYAQPWLDKAKMPIAVTGNTLEQISLNCSSSIEMLYACKYGYGLP
jgi:hypothetical protein